MGSRFLSVNFVNNKLLSSLNGKFFFSYIFNKLGINGRLFFNFNFFKIFVGSNIIYFLKIFILGSGYNNGSFNINKFIFISIFFFIIIINKLNL